MTLVLAAGAGTIPAALVKAVERSGVALDTTVGTGRARTQWLTEHLHAGPCPLDARAGDMLSEHLGGDVSRLEGLLDTLAAAYGDGAAIDPERLEPFLGEAGSLPPWELTDAIDGGDTAGALDALRRQFGRAGCTRSGDGDAAPALSGHAAPRRLGCHLTRRGRRPARHAQLVPGQEGARAVPAPGTGGHQPGHHAVGRR